MKYTPAQLADMIQEGFDFAEAINSVPDLADVGRSFDKGDMKRYQGIQDIALRMRKADKTLSVEDALRAAKKEWDST